jgi:hypothetical protein
VAEPVLESLNISAVAPYYHELQQPLKIESFQDVRLWSSSHMTPLFFEALEPVSKIRSSNTKLQGDLS